MSDPIISLFIDDELDLDDKIEFVENISASPLFKDETVALLNQEKLIRSRVVDSAPAIPIKTEETENFFLAISPRRLDSFICRSWSNYFDALFHPCKT